MVMAQTMKHQSEILCMYPYSHKYKKKELTAK